MITAASLAVTMVEQFLALFRAGQVQDIGPGLETRAGDAGLIRLDRDQEIGRAQLLNHRQQPSGLTGFIHQRGGRQGDSVHDDAGALGLRTLRAGLPARVQADAFAIPGIRRGDTTPAMAGWELEMKGLAAQGKSLHAPGRRRGFVPAILRVVRASTSGQRRAGAERWRARRDLNARPSA